MTNTPPLVSFFTVSHKLMFIGSYFGMKFLEKNSKTNLRCRFLIIWTLPYVSGESCRHCIQVVFVGLSRERELATCPMFMFTSTSHAFTLIILSMHTLQLAVWLCCAPLRQFHWRHYVSSTLKIQWLIHTLKSDQFIDHIAYFDTFEI